MNEIKPREILDVLRIVESRVAGDAAKRLRVLLSQIFNHAVASQYCEYNPADQVAKALRPVVKGQFNFVVNKRRLGEMLNRVDKLDCWPASKALAQLQPMLFCRPSELRQLLWQEVDLISKKIKIPAKKMKRSDNGDLVISISTQALAVLQNLKLTTGHTEFVFASNRRDPATGEYRPLSDGALKAALKKAGILSSEQHPHGFRHTASTLLNEAGYASDLIELQLHHKDNTIRGVYNHSEKLGERQNMMQKYSDMLEEFKRVAASEGY